MATRTIKARVELDGEKQYKQALSELNSGNKVLASEMRKLQAEYKGNADSVEFLNKKSDVLQRQLQQQKDKVNTLREAVANAGKQYGEADKRTQDWIVKLNNAEAAQFDLEHAIEENNQAINGQTKEMSGLGDTVSDLANKLGIKLPQSATNALNGMSKLSTGTVAAMGAAVAGVMALVNAVKGLQEETLEAAARADDIMTRATQMNISTTQYQALQYASPFVDVDVDSLASSLAKITQAMGDAQAGSEAAKESFRNLGVEITNVSDGSLRNAYDVWLDTMDALAQMGDETERDIAAQELLGKSAATFAPIYREGTEALRGYTEEAEKNYALSDQQLKKLGEVDDARNQLDLSIQHSRDMIAVQWAPTVKEALEAFNKLVTAAGKALVDSGILTAFGELVKLAISLLEPITSLFTAADQAPGKLAPVEAALRGVAYVLATIQDSINVIRGLLPWNWGSGLTRTALGWNTSQGQLSATGKLYYGDTSSYGWVYDENAGGWVGNYGRNAAGTQNWRGGLTWVGEAGPELVRLPKGSQVYNAQDSRGMATTVNNYITVNGIEQLDEVVRWYEGRQVAARMRG